MKEKKEKPTMLNAQVPESIAKKLQSLAKAERRSRKNYIEILLIKHVEENKNTDLV